MESLHQKFKRFEEALYKINFMSGLGVVIDDGLKLFHAFYREYVTMRLEEIDEIFKENPSIRKQYSVQKKGQERSLLTKIGEIRYKRRYYRDRRGGYSYLVDRAVGIDRYERIERSLGAALSESSGMESYAKASKRCCGGSLSRTSVMRVTRRAHEESIGYPEKPAELPEIHLQCDEDHVSMQDGKTRIVKVCTIHGTRKKGPIKGRYYLPYRYSLTSQTTESNEDFWDRIGAELEGRYKCARGGKVYIHGDGAGWIKAGVEAIAGSRYVLDRFHLIKAMKPVSGGNKDYYGKLLSVLKMGKPELMESMVKACIDEEVCDRETGETFLSYYWSNVSGITIWNEIGFERSSSCAEGLVSHLLSERLSSRPKGWGEVGLDTISRIRIHLENGGRINAEAMRKKEEKNPITKKAKQTIQRKMSPYLPMPTTVLQDLHHQSARWRLFESLKEAGMAF